MTLFVDTSAFYAASDNADGNHSRAREALAAAGPFLTTDHVLVESWLLMDRRFGHYHADRFWSEIRRGLARVETVLPPDLDRAWQIGEAFPDQDFSIVDRTSFAVMERLGIHSVATFDDHFAIYRFGPHRDRAFEIRR